MAYMIMPVYNIDQPVGQGKPNLAEDVKLVQTMLNAVMRGRPRTPASLPPLPEDGRFSPAVTAWILEFQRTTNSHNSRSLLREDGIVHPMPVNDSRDWGTTFASGRTSTMWPLNDFMRRRSRPEHTSLATRLLIRDNTPSSRS